MQMQVTMSTAPLRQPKQPVQLEPTSRPQARPRALMHPQDTMLTRPEQPPKLPVL